MNSSVKIVTTEDGSLSLFSEDFGAFYHSKHGAIQESQHVFIKSGLQYYRSKYPLKTKIDILEFGFGTGLNALLALHEIKDQNLIIHYTGIETYPVALSTIQLLNYGKLLDSIKIFNELHQHTWDNSSPIVPNFILTKMKLPFEEITNLENADLIFYDAFGPDIQAHLWGEKMASILFAALRKEGILVTFSAKGSFRRALAAAGFKVTKIPGPPGKREMTRAFKP